MNQIMVSICCITYNHEKYISQAMDSFLIQKADFNFEILIHDDASTDCTAKTLKEYEQRYPEIVKPIYQAENQYSKGAKIDLTYNFPRVRGKYIAICEGDDYWTDPLKLQRQVDYMELHPECSLCTHGAKMIDSKGKLIGKVRPGIGNKSFSSDEVILGGGGFFSTNSLLFRTDLARELPDFYKNAPIGDYPLTIFLALMGDVYYIDSCMSVYRYMAEGSWSKKMAVSAKARNEHHKKISNMLQEVNEYTNYRYNSIINEKILINEFSFLLEKFDIKKIKLDKYQKFYHNLTIWQKTKIYLNAYFPFITNFARRLKIIADIFKVSIQ